MVAKKNICTLCCTSDYFLRFQFHDQLPVVSTTGALQTFSVSKIWKSERISSPGRSIHSVLEIKKETSHDMLSPCQKCPRARSSSTPLESLVANRCKDNAYETSWQKKVNLHTMTDFVTGDSIALWTFTRRRRIQIACQELNATTSSFKDKFVICAIKKLRQKHAHIEHMTWNLRCPWISFYFSASQQLCCLFRVRWPTFQTWCKSVVTQR